MVNEEPTNEWQAFKKAQDAGEFTGQYADWMEQVIKKQRSKNDPVALTTERGSVHGDWLQQAKLGNQLKAQLRRGKNWNSLEPHQAEALDMIATKISRILTGDSTHADHWDDIAGYAYLGKSGHQPS